MVPFIPGNPAASGVSFATSGDAGGVTTDINGEPRSVFRNDGTTYAGAFEFVQADTGTELEQVELGSNNVRVFSIGSQITITSAQQIQSVKLIDLHGRTIHTQTGIGLNIYSFQVPNSGVFMVELSTAAGRSVEKVIVR
jgi:hypothetical protein